MDDDRLFLTNFRLEYIFLSCIYILSQLGITSLVFFKLREIEHNDPQHFLWLLFPA